VIQVLGGRCNVFLVSGRHCWLLVDTSWKWAWRTLSARLDRLLPDRSALDALVLTHAHFDHAENAARIQDKYPVQIIVQREEAAWLASGENPLPRGTNAATRWLTDTFAARIEPHVRYRPVSPDCIVDRELDLRPLGFNALLLHTPGHSPGSMSLIVDDEIALVGDTLYGAFPGTAFPPFADDPQVLFASWERLLATGCEIFLPAHGTARGRSLVQRQLEASRHTRSIE
jgi:glyoxylase-like metal-dependent hydrolase (beta-lactamase superfamily II)